MKRLVITTFLEEEHLAALTTEAERATAAQFRSAARRAEYLSWRAVVRRELGDVAISYDDVGAPCIDRDNIYIGVSHCKGHVAVAISDERCAVDIELADRNFSRAARRFITDKERAIVRHPLAEGLVWCAKETLYKLSGRKELDFVRDLQIVAFDLTFGSSRGTMLGRIADGGEVMLEFGILDALLIEVHTR